MSEMSFEFVLLPKYFTTFQITLSHSHRRLPPFLMYRAHVVFKHRLPFYTFKRTLFRYLYRLLAFPLQWRFSFLKLNCRHAQVVSCKIFSSTCMRFHPCDFAPTWYASSTPSSWIVKRMPVE